MWVFREKVARFALHIGEIAASAARHKDFLARFVGVIQQQYLTPAPCSRQRAHKSGRTGTNNHDMGRQHSSILNTAAPAVARSARILTDDFTAVVRPLIV